jgi:hypothetical protein
MGRVALADQRKLARTEIVRTHRDNMCVRVEQLKQQVQHLSSLGESEKIDLSALAEASRIVACENTRIPPLLFHNVMSARRSVDDW